MATEIVSKRMKLIVNKKESIMNFRKGVKGARRQAKVRYLKHFKWLRYLQYADIELR